MNIVLLADKKIRKTFELAVKNEPEINLVGVEMVIRGNTMSRIADHHNPHVLVVYRNVPEKDGITLDDVISFLQMKRPNMRIVYVYGNITDHEEYIQMAEHLIENHVYDIICDNSAENAVSAINAPMTEEDARKSIEDIRSADEKEQLVVEDDDLSDVTYEELDLDFPAVTTNMKFDIDNVLVISDSPAKEVQTINIGIAQLQHHNGCTHTALEIASLLSKKNSVAVVFADNDTYERLAVYHKINPLAAHEGMNYNGIDIYPYSKHEELPESYNAVIYDYSYLREEQKNSFDKCELKILLASAAEWDISTLVKYVEYNDPRYIRDISILIPRVSPSKFSKYNKRFLKSGVSAYRLHNSPNWTAPNAENLEIYKKILSPYTIKPIAKPKKRLFKIK